MASARPSGADVTPSPIDAATLRVFAVGTVGIENIELSDGTSVAVAKASSGHGTGFVLDDGLVMTAQHVVADARHVVVRLPGDGGFFPARVVFADKAKDVAVLAVDGTLPPALALSEAALRVRSTVFTVGYPVDATRKQAQSARGIIAGFLDDGTVQLDMSLNPGNSGGPVVDEHDQVVGMAIARGDVEHGVQGIGYAVPVSMLRAILSEAQRRLQTGEATRAVGMSRESATVVDELVQHGAFYELRKNSDFAAAPVANLDKAFDAVLARIQDADLLVFVASAMWNAALALEYVEPTKLKITSEQASTLRIRLRESAQRAVHRAVALDRTVGSRSTFVALATNAVDPVNAPSTVAAVNRGIEGEPVNAHLSVEVAPIVRANGNTGSWGWGVGGAIRLTMGRDRSPVVPFLGLAAATVRVANDNGSFSHSLLAAQGGIVVRADKLSIAAMLEGSLYAASVDTAIALPSNAEAVQLALSGRACVGYRIGRFVVGAAVRAFRGPTLWIEPVTLALPF